MPEAGPEAVPGPGADHALRPGLIGSLLVLGTAQVGLLIAFAFSLNAASREFEHALIAQQQASLVADIARDADTRSDAVLAQSLGTYRDLIAAEARYVLPADQAAQAQEVRRAQDLARMAAIPARRAALAAQVQAIARDEAGEVAMARARLDRTRRDTLVLGGLLAAVAVVATLLGARQLLGANRVLTAQVAARTAAIDAIDRSRRLFFAQASHELRTPVTAIRTLAEVTLDSGAPAQRALADIVAQTGFLDHRIADMLALARAGEGEPLLAFTPADLVAVIDAAVAQAAAYAGAIEVALRWDRSTAEIGAAIDARWLGQAILTVIDNGLKFSDPGAQLVIACEARDGRAVITIADSGPGVLPRDLPRIFDAYYQSDEGRLRGGTGLGLALARWVTEAHGGSIHAENRSGGGCRIVIDLPMVAA